MLKVINIMKTEPEFPFKQCMKIKVTNAIKMILIFMKIHYAIFRLTGTVSILECWKN